MVKVWMLLVAIVGLVGCGVPPAEAPASPSPSVESAARPGVAPADEVGCQLRDGDCIVVSTPAECSALGGALAFCPEAQPSGRGLTPPSGAAPQFECTPFTFCPGGLCCGGTCIDCNRSPPPCHC